MKAHLITGSKREIADTVLRMEGEVREAILFVDETPASPLETGPLQAMEEDIFAEMEPYTVSVGNADYSREALYTPLEGE